jgi:hypothetical protein
MAETVYLLGAGFNYSVFDPSRDRLPPLAKNFFQVLMQDDSFDSRLEGIRQHIPVDYLFEEIQHYWHLDLAALKTTPFDIEECLTLFESQLQEGPSEDRARELIWAMFALRNLLLMYLGDMSFSGYTPTGRRFGTEVIAAGADVLTFNYDTLAETAIESASGFSEKVSPARREQSGFEEPVADEDLDASHNAWRPGLAYGFEFDEVVLPVAGVSRYIEGSRYYAHPKNKLYEHNRVLKLHGSIDWLRYTDIRLHPGIEPNGEPPPKGLVLTSHPMFWMGDSPIMDLWRMEPIIIPPLLYKNFREHPFPAVWSAALETLKECKTLTRLFRVGAEQAGAR